MTESLGRLTEGARGASDFGCGEQASVSASATTKNPTAVALVTLMVVPGGTRTRLGVYAFSSREAATSDPPGHAPLTLAGDRVKQTFVPRDASPRLPRRELLLLGAGLLWTPAAGASVSPYTRRGLLDQNGSDRSLAEVAAGKTLVLVVMKGHYCAVCRAQLARLEAISARFQRLGARVAALNADPVEANRAIAEKYAFSMPILSDRDHAVSEGLSLWHAEAGHPMPAIVVFDACGSEVSRSVGRSVDDRPEAALIALARRLHELPPNCTVA